MTLSAMPTGSFEGLLEPYARHAVLCAEEDALIAMHDAHKRDIADLKDRIDRTLREIG